MKVFKSMMMGGAILLGLTMCLTSCEGTLDDLFGEWSNPSGNNEGSAKLSANISLTTEGAKITATSLKQLSSSLLELTSEIQNATANGKDYKVEVAMDPQTAASDYTIVVPKVNGSNINLVFNQALSTSAATLLVKASEANATSSLASANKLTITLPDASGLDVKVDMPETTVTLKSSGTNTVFSSSAAKTALNTFVIEDGVTLKAHDMIDGRIVVMDGGKIESFVYYPNGRYLWMFDQGLHPEHMPSIKENGEEDWDNITFPILDGNGNPYYIRNLKIIKGGEGCTKLQFLGSSDSQLDKLTIADGAIANNFYSGRKNVPIGTIVGEGDARFMYGEFFTSPVDDSPMYYSTINLSPVSSLSGVAFAPLYVDKPIINNEEFRISNIPANTKDCKFEAEHIDGIGSGIEDCEFKYSKSIDIKREKYTDTYTVKNCKFTNTADVLNDLMIVSGLPIPDEISSFTVTFDGCEFSDKVFFRFVQILNSDKNGLYPFTVDNFKYTIVFKNCTYGGSAINAANGICGQIAGNDTTNPKFIVEIDGTQYTPTNDVGNNLITLAAIE